MARAPGVVPSTLRVGKVAQSVVLITWSLALVFVTLFAGEYGISPGQACVFYADESETSEVLGGGFIAEAVPSALVA